MSNTAAPASAAGSPFPYIIETGAQLTFTVPVLAAGTTSSTITLVPFTSGATLLVPPPASTPSTTTVTVTGTSVTTSATESRPPPSRTNGTSTSRTSTGSGPARTVTNTNLGGGPIAGLAVVSAVAAGALIALLLLVISKRRNAKKHEAVNDSTELKLTSSFVGNDKATTVGLQTTLEDRDSTIRELQAALLKQGKQRGEPVLDNVQLRNRFGVLANSINDWVVTYFKDSLASTSTPLSVADKVKQIVPQYQKLMQQSRTRYLVVRAVASKVLFENFDNGSLVGNSDFKRMRKELIQDGYGNEYKEWEALTTRLLERTPKYQSRKELATEAVAKEIDELTRGLTGLQSSEDSFRFLKRIVDTAADLAVLLAKQPASYRLVEERPGMVCDPNTMEDVLQELNSAAIRSRNVLAPVFPAVQKWDSEQGSIPLCIRKAQVMVS